MFRGRFFDQTDGKLDASFEDLGEQTVKNIANPNGLPVLFVHGGPSGGCTGDDRLLFDPEAWARWEARTSSLYPDAARLEKFGSPDFAEAFAGIELHYFVNRGFFAYDGQLLADADRLAGIPGVIVHGRYDMVCPVTNAFDLHAHWLDSELEIVADAGHDADEPDIRDALIRATDRFGSLGSTKP